jgi:RNA polymerase sigma-70 factor (ECF subfamily)
LVRAVARGDRDAFRQLYDLFAPPVFGLCLGILNDAGAAEDASQRTFLKLWTRADSYNPARGSLRTWLLTIARREAIDAYRSLRRRANRLVPEAEALLGRMADPASLGEEGRWHAVRLGLARLPQDQRIPIVLAFYFGLSHVEIADHLGVPLGTVKTRIRIGVEKLRAAWSTSPRASDSAGRSVGVKRRRMPHA